MLFGKYGSMIDNFNNIFRGKRILITGHTGFKGSWLTIWLNELGAEIIGYALEPYTDRDNFVLCKIEDKITHIVGDVRNFDKLKMVFEKYEPEFVFHLAAQPIVRESYINPKDTLDINIGGTINVLECCRLADSVKVIINVTSDKCYENKDWVWGYRENDSLGGYDPYSSSKGCSELITAAFRYSFFNPGKLIEHGKSLSSVRAGNVIGGGDWQMDRLIPDCVKALENKESIAIRNPKATRPWQHVLEPLSGYLLLASKMYLEPDKYSGAWNFGPNYESVKSVGKIVDFVIEKWGNGNWFSTSSQDDLHEAKLLALDTNKAKNKLGWKPRWDIKKCVEKTIEWYKDYPENVYDLCVNQIIAYSINTI